jgi:hypothetical protein
MRHCTVAAAYSDAVNLVSSSKIQWERSKVRGVSQGYNGASTATLKAGSSFKFLDIGSVSSVCLQAEGDNAGEDTYNYEVANCTFGDATNRQVVFAVDDNGEMPAGWNVHHCKFTNPTGDQTAGNECLESFSGKNIRFAHNWVTECPEDAFEHANARENVTIEHSVADNCTGNAADLFNATGGENIDAHIHHIYGDTSTAAVVTAGVSNFHIHDIVVETTDDLIRLGGGPDNALVTGPLSRPGVVANQLVSLPNGLGTDSAVLYWDGNQIVTEGTPPTNWTAIR